MMGFYGDDSACSLYMEGLWRWYFMVHWPKDRFGLGEPRELVIRWGIWV